MVVAPPVIIMKMKQVTIGPNHARPVLLKKNLLNNGNATIMGIMLNNRFTNSHCGPSVEV